MSSTTTEEVIILDESHEEISKNPNLNVVDKTIISFNETLPPGVAPEGFMLIDEDSDLSIVQTCKNKDNLDDEKSESPLLSVLFKDKSVQEKYGPKIERFMKDMITSRSRRRTVTFSKKELLLEIYECTDSHSYSSDHTDSKDKHRNDTLFLIDTEPKLQDDLDIPMYGKKFQRTLQKETGDDGHNNKEDHAPKMTCFNCLGNHNLRDCDQPKNFVAINKNRKEYNVKRGPLNARYHTDDDQRFGHFVTGQISPNLRKALGLRENELPRHIYRMRMLGYPPGWLEEARLQHSGLALFNSEGVAERDDEEGEIILPGDKDKYDIKKIIDFPGFNIYPPEGTIEEYEQYWGSSQQEYFSKDAMLSYLSTKKADAGYKRKKLPNVSQGKSGVNLNPGEMEVDEIEDASTACVPAQCSFVPPLPQDDTGELKPPPPPEDIPLPPQESAPEDFDSTAQGNLNEEGISRDDSPSLVELENTKKQLLAELNDTSSQSNSDSGKVEEPKLNTPKMEGVELDSSKPDVSNENINNVTPKSNSKTHKQAIDMTLGTPILHSSSPFKRLPASEKFSKDISDVINFENLPDSTGKYEQMTGVIQKVRSKLAELHKE